MAPSIDITDKFKIYFYSNDHEPIHVHVKVGERECRVEVEGLTVSDNQGFTSRQLKEICKIISSHNELIKEVWSEHFKSKTR